MASRTLGAPSWKRGGAALGVWRWTRGEGGVFLAHARVLQRDVVYIG
jgi:hypothetical protein